MARGANIAVGPGWLLVGSLTYFVCVTACNSWWDLLILFSLLAAASAVLKIRAGSFLDVIKSAWIMIAMAAVFHFVFRYWFVGAQDVTVFATLLQSSFFVWRLALLIFMTFALLTVYSPAVYAETVASKVGFVIGRTSAGHASQVSFLAFSMLPQIKEHVASRQFARSLRGIGMPSDSRGKLARARADLSSVLHFALDYAADVATVLWSRGFRPENLRNMASQRRTSLTAQVLAGCFCLLCLTTLLPWPTN